MNDFVHAPFSARNKGPHRQIDSAFPDSARTGLFYLLIDLVERAYVGGWLSVCRELQRTARSAPVAYDERKSSDVERARADAHSALDELSWDKVYDFCERLYGRLAQDVGYHPQNDEYFEITTRKSEVQAYIEGEIQRLFAEEGLAFEFSEGLIRRRGRKHSTELTTRAQVVLGDPALSSARRHYDKALQFFRNREKPDYENCVKEAVCAVEAAGKALFPQAKAATLGDLAKWLPNAGVPKALAQIVTAIYAYRSGGDGIGHGGAAGGVASQEVAEFALAVCASQIIYFVDLTNAQEHDAPF